MAPSDKPIESNGNGQASLNGWAEYKRFVLAEIERMSDNQAELQKSIVEEIKGLRQEFGTRFDAISKSMAEMRDCQTMLKVKMGIISGLSGMAAGAIIGALVSLLMR